MKCEAVDVSAVGLKGQVHLPNQVGRIHLSHLRYAMKFYGKQGFSEAMPTALEEVTLVVTVKEAAQLILFLEKCVYEMSGNPKWEHAHFNDHLSHGESGGLIIFSEEAAAKL